MSGTLLKAQGFFKKGDCSTSFMFPELLATIYTLQSFAAGLEHTFVIRITDSTSTCTVCKKGSMKRWLHQLAWDIHDAAATHHISLQFY